MFPKCLVALALVPALLAPLHTQAGALYTPTVLPDNFNPSDINNAGQIAGTLSFGTAGTHAAVWAGGALTDLGTFGSDSAYATAINDAGAVTGTAFSAGNAVHSFLYSGGSSTDLGAGTYALGINTRGDVVGQKLVSEGNYTSFLYSNGSVTTLGNLGTGNVGLAYDINDAGKIVGSSNINTELHAPFHPFLYSHDALHDLGTLAGMEDNSAQAINNAGRIAGYSEAADGGLHAFVYEHGHMRDVGSFGGLWLDVGGINEHGQFVGSASTPTGSIGYMYRRGALVDLNTLLDPALGWEIDGAYGINDAGQIAAHGCRDFVCSALRLDLASAVPEPGSALMLAPGLLLLAVARRRSQRGAAWQGGAAWRTARPAALAAGA